MKSPVLSIFVLMCFSFVSAQSGNVRFIDSPSWILAQEGGSDVRSPETAVSEARRQTGVTSREDSDAGSSPRPAQKRQESAGTQASLRPVAPKKEGFFHVGVYVTPVINWLSSLNKPYSRSGVTACVTPTVMLDMRLFGRFYVGVGAALNTFGGKVRYPDLGQVKHERSYMFSYVEIPARIKWQTRNFAGSKGSIFLSAGVNLGFGVSYKYKDIYDGPIPFADGSTIEGVLKHKGRMKKDSRLVNLAGVAQVGYNYQIAPRVNLVMGVEYHYGFVRPVKKGKLVDGLGKPTYNNQQVGLVLGVMF